MKRILFLLTLLCIERSLQAQYVYTIKADSVKITNTCDTAELIIENHTQNVPGFLFNKGRGRTEFRKPLLKVNDSIYLVGGDSLKMNAWLQGGNRFGATGIFGTMDNNHVDFYSNSLQRARLTNSGAFQIGNHSNDNGDILQVGNNGAVTIAANLSRSSDRIQIGKANNFGDGQNVLIRTSNDNGTSYKDILVERDGYIGLGTSNRPVGGWFVGNPALRILSNGMVNIGSNYFIFGNTGGEWNASGLYTYVSNTDEWHSGLGNYPNRQHYYYFGTGLSGPEGSNVRANLKISGRELNFLTGVGEAEAMRVAESKNVLIGTTNDNGDKLQVIGNVFANGNQHKLGNLAIISGSDVGTTGFNTGIRIDDPTNSFIFQGTNQGWAKDMFVFTDAYGGIGQDVYLPDQSIIRIKSGIKSNNIAGNSANILNIQPEYNLNPAVSNPLIMRGIYYKPTLTSVISGSKHIAIETVTGDVLLGTTSGSTGIGTSAPTAQLHTTGTVRFGGLTSNNSLTRMVVSDANGNLYYKEDSSSGAFNGALNSDLAVNGRISAQKMLITQTGRWPDYVFSKQYKLPSLSEVESFINQNSHLPGIPSAAEVEKKGIDVGNNQAVLLKKIEELTLYVIEQNKKLQQQSEEITELKMMNKSIELLKQQLAELKTMINNK